MVNIKKGGRIRMKKLVVLLLAAFIMLIAWCSSNPISDSCRIKIPGSITSQIHNNQVHVLFMTPKAERCTEFLATTENITVDKNYNIFATTPINRDIYTTDLERKAIDNAVTKLSKQYQTVVYGRLLDKHDINGYYIVSTFSEDYVLIRYNDGCILRAKIDLDSNYKYLEMSGYYAVEHTRSNNSEIIKQLNKTITFGLN